VAAGKALVDPIEVDAPVRIVELVHDRQVGYLADALTDFHPVHILPDYSAAQPQSAQYTHSGDAVFRPQSVR
jgi:hypothetical protein